LLFIFLKKALRALFKKINNKSETLPYPETYDKLDGD